MNQEHYTRSLSHAVGMEKSVLSTFLQEPLRLATAHGLTAQSFYLPAHQTLFDHIATIESNGDKVELVGLVQSLIDAEKLESIGGAAAITEICSYAPTTSYFEQHLRGVHERHSERLRHEAARADLACNFDQGDQLRVQAEKVADLANNGGKANAPQFIHADELEDNVGAFDFVEDVLSDGASSVIYGASNSGKTFFAIDLAAHVATGRKWQGKEVEKGAVLYIALEGRQGAVNRIKAMRRKSILPTGAPFFLRFSPVNLLDPTHPAVISRLIERVTAAAGIPVRLVIIDTLARAMASGDENSGKDMGEAVKTVDAVRATTGAHVCIIHHCGKDAARGARGHSSLRAAIDTEIEVIHPEGDKYRTASFVKQRDLASIAPLCFSLEAVEVGTNRRGKPITSCVVKEEDGIMAHKKGKAGAKAKYNSQMLLDLLPQPTVAAWRAEANKKHGMGEDAFENYKGKCASQWRKEKQGGIVKFTESLLDIE